ncbi:MAG: L-lactate dehydrogenase [Pseudobdellovibrionaceae bacterium]
MKIGIIGAGQVGSAIAYACVLEGIADEIVIIDQNESLAKAQAEDLLHATPFASMVQVRQGQYNDLEGATLVMIAAGAAQKQGETRLDLLQRNADIFAKIIPQILKAAPDTLLLVASNPVDVITHLVAKIAAQTHNISPSRVIGSGTILDTARFRAEIAKHIGVSNHSVHAYVLGEHGDSEVLHWSGATIGNIPLTNFAAQVASPLTQESRAQIDNLVRRAAYRIIQGKGATWFGIGAGMARLAATVLRNENAVMTVSSPLSGLWGEGKPVCLSLPRVIGSSGISATLMPELTQEEETALKRSRDILLEATHNLLN